MVFLATLGTNDVWLLGTQNGNTSLYGLLCLLHRALYLKYSAFEKELDFFGGMKVIKKRVLRALFAGTV